MDQVNELTDMWNKTINSLLHLPKENRTHFALMVVALAECYVPDNKSRAVVLVDNGETMSFISAGANEYEAFELIDKAHTLMANVHTIDAPEKGYFN